MRSWKTPDGNVRAARVAKTPADTAPARATASMRIRTALLNDR
ncbi:hypothetical protein LG3211_2117 [Lysobacter gummosus]|nr:hypothetical protein LG3211_2117 [Lysobacter gummosus]